MSGVRRGSQGRTLGCQPSSLPPATSKLFLNAPQRAPGQPKRARIYISPTSAPPGRISPSRSLLYSQNPGDPDGTHTVIVPSRPPSAFTPLKNLCAPRAPSTASQGASSRPRPDNAGNERQPGDRAPGIRVELRAAHSHIWQFHPRASAAAKCHPSHAHDETRHHSH